MRPQVGIEVGSIEARTVIVVVEAEPGAVALSGARALPATRAPSSAASCETSPPGTTTITAKTDMPARTTCAYEGRTA
jgi:hypothetical protein